MVRLLTSRKILHKKTIMSLETQLMQDLKTAMKAKDKVALRSIRAVKAALLLQKTDGTGEDMTEEKEIKLLQKMVKQR